MAGLWYGFPILEKPFKNLVGDSFCVNREEPMCSMDQTSFEKKKKSLDLAVFGGDKGNFREKDYVP